MTPAAIIPMHTPDEAIEELDFVTKELGSKVGMFGSAMPRQTASIKKGDNADTDRLAVWYEVFGIDSIYDYDPVWQKCLDVKIAPTFHSAGSNQALRNSPTNFTYNHIRHFAAAVSRRRGRLGQPTLRRPDRALGTAQRQGIGAHAPRQARPRQIDEPRREIRL